MSSNPYGNSSTNSYDTCICFIEHVSCSSLACKPSLCRYCQTPFLSICSRAITAPTSPGLQPLPCLAIATLISAFIIRLSPPVQHIWAHGCVQLQSYRNSTTSAHSNHHNTVAPITACINHRLYQQIIISHRYSSVINQSL